MKYKTLLEMAQSGFDELAGSAVDEFKKLDLEQHGQAPADLGLRSVWDEYKEQAQNEESFAFAAYEATLRQFIRKELESLIEWELLVLWAATDRSNSASFDSEGDCLMYEDVCEAIESEVYTRIYNRAEFEEIEYREGFGPEGEDDAEEGEEGEEDEASVNGNQLELF